MNRPEPGPLRAALRALAGSVRLASPGQPGILTGTEAGRTAALASAEGPFAGLTAALYARYCNWQQGTAADPSPEFLDTLRAANPMRRRSVGGWRFVRADAAGVIVVNIAGEHRLVEPGALVVAAGAFAPGGAVRLDVPRERLTSPLGHYMVLGGPIHAHRTGRQTRFYWNIPAAGAADFLTKVCRPLADRRIPFEAKVPAAEQGYGRTDAAVLYMNAEHVEAARGLLETAHQALYAQLGDATPLLAERLGRGLAFAETPPENGSFGLHRCTLLAQWLTEAARRGVTGSNDVVEFLCAQFSVNGFDPAQPARNPGSRYPYRLPKAAP